jgi:uncharacterized protein YdiU (UPF0061 family)
MSASTGAAPRPIDQLAFGSRFVERLPGDPSRDRTSRQVQGALYSEVEPTPVSSPRLLALVPEVAALLGLDSTPTQTLAEVLSGNRLVAGMRPHAACYGGHQFGNWAGQLGDGRAISLGEVEGPAGRLELQLKGAGPTPYSRRSDGRAVLRSSLRELVCSEAMAHLGVPTTRALSLVATGDGVVRDMFYDGRPEVEPGAIVCRVAPSFVRFGSFELPASRGDVALLRALTAFVIDEHYPHLRHGEALDLGGLLEEVARRTARLMVHWMRVGFVHGVMNTDNLSILGLTIDYGPYGWIDSFDLGWTPNTTDAAQRRYRFGHQPHIGQWNLLKLAEALSLLLPDRARLEAALDVYVEEFTSGQLTMMRDKLGLEQVEQGDEQLFDEVVSLLADLEADMTLFYRALGRLPSSSAEPFRPVVEPALYRPERLAGPLEERLARWVADYRARLGRQGLSDAERRRRMERVNPLYVPRNYLVQQVIERVTAGEESALGELLEVLRRPYEEQPGRDAYAAKRPDWARHRPGCSMLSCSS